MRIKKLIKVLILALVFLASLAGFSLLTPTGNADLTSEMPEATLPVLSLSSYGQKVNELFGYKGEIDPISARDTITPLSEDMMLPVSIRVFENKIEGISYEVRSLDTQRLIENTRVEDFSRKEGEIHTELNIQNLLEDDREYLLTITLLCNGEEIHYYTRIIRAFDWHVEDSIDFAMNFHTVTFRPERASEIAMYLEPNSEGDNTTLQKVTIHSSMNQVTWGDFQGEVLKDPIPSIKELGSASNVILLNYVVAASGEEGETEFYNVEEYYRLRYSTLNDRMYLLDYERTMEEVFRGSGDNLTDTGLLLGIRNGDVSYMTNEDGSIVSFVQDGDLWSYNSSTNQLSLVYSFRGIEGFSDRANNREHDIRIIKIDESGSVDFVVYGYMNRGTYEGQTGIGLFHYDRMANTVEEVLFVQSDQTYQLLKETWGQLFYVSEEGYFYMIAEGDFYRIRLADGESAVLRSGQREDSYAVSGDGRYVAFGEKDNEIIVMDLEGEKQWQVTGSPSELLRPIGFVESDFVYGIAQRTQEEFGELLYKVIIMDKSQTVIKEYEKAGYYITDAYVEDDTVFLERAWMEGNVLTAVEPDAIKSHEIASSRNVQVEMVREGAKQTQVTLKMGKELVKTAPQVLTPKEVVQEEKKVARLDTRPVEGCYYVYARGNVVLSTEKVGEAIDTADVWAGAVLDGSQRYIWRRGRDASMSMAAEIPLGQEELSESAGNMERCLKALLKYEGINLDVASLLASGQEPEQILADAMPEALVLNLHGLTVSQALYYVNQSCPVLALGEGQEPVLIVGYDERNLVLYYPETNSTARMGLNDSEEYFAEAGGFFVSYLKQ